VGYAGSRCVYAIHDSSSPVSVRETLAQRKVGAHRIFVGNVLGVCRSSLSQHALHDVEDEIASRDGPTLQCIDPEIETSCVGVAAQYVSVYGGNEVKGRERRRIRGRRFG